MKEKIKGFKKVIGKEVKSLKSFDFNSLDFKESGQWPMIVKAIMIAFVVVIILFLGNNFHIKNLNKKMLSLESKEDNLLAEIEAHSYVIPTIKDYEEQLIKLSNNLEKIKQQLPEKIEMSSILDDMTQLASESNVTILSINLDNEIKTENYIELPFKIKAKGKFHNFASFLSELSRINRIVTVHDVIIQPNDSDSLLEMEFVAKTYKYKSKEDDNKKDKKYE